MMARGKRRLFSRGSMVLAFALLSWLLFAGVAHAQESDEFERPDHIILDIHAKRYPLGPDRRPDETQPKYSSVVARFKIFEDRGELLECAYPGNEHQFVVSVAPPTASNKWSFSFGLPRNEPGGIANPMTYSISEVPWPGFASDLEIDENGVFGFINTRLLGEVAWTKVDADTAAALGGSEWVITGADGFSMTVVDNGENDEDPAVGSMKVTGLKWGVRKSTGNLWGAYELSETKAPEGYGLDTGSYSFKVNESTDFTAPIVVGPIANSKLLGEVAWTKVDADTAAALGGSEWVITGADGFSMTVVDNGENDGDPAVGSLKATGLKWGVYELSETKAPEGYERKRGPHAFEINGSNVSPVLDPIANSRIPGDPNGPADPPAKAARLAETGDSPIAPAIIAGAGFFALLAAFALHRIRRMSCE